MPTIFARTKWIGKALSRIEARQKKHALGFLALFFIPLLFVTCEEPEPFIPNPSPGDEVETIIPTGDEQYLNMDGRFTRYHFEDGEGNLYKEVWPIGMDGQAYFEQIYLSHLKTNETENPSAALIRGFGQEIAGANSDSLKSVIAKWMNVVEILSYAVVDRTIRNDDGPFHWYCDGGGCSNHNYYWYEEPTNEILHLIPWDLDNAFENIVSNVNPVTPIADAWGGTSNNCNPFSYGQFGFWQWSAACDKLTGGWASFTDEYAQLKAQFIEGPLSEAQVNAQLDAWAAQVRDATIEADQSHLDAISVSEWESALNSLKNKLEYARNH